MRHSGGTVRHSGGHSEVISGANSEVISGVNCGVNCGVILSVLTKSSLKHGSFCQFCLETKSGH